MRKDRDNHGDAGTSDRLSFTGAAGRTPPIDKVVPSGADLRVRVIPPDGYSSAEFAAAAHYNAEARKLPDVLAGILADPTANLIEDTEDEPDQIGVLEFATLQKPESEVLVPTWKLLAQQATDTEGPLQARLAAVMIGNALLDQTSRPVSKKKFAGMVDGKPTGSLTRLNAAFILDKRYDTPSMVAGFKNRKNIARATSDEPVHEFAERLGATDPEAVIGQISDIDAYVGLRSGSLFAACQVMTDYRGVTATLNAIALDHAPRILTSPQAGDALLSGAIEATSSDVRYSIWKSTAVRENVSTDERSSAPQVDDVSEYLLAHPDVQATFWQDFLTDNGDGTIDMTGPVYLGRFLRAHPDRAGELLATVDLGNRNSREQRLFLRQLAGVVSAVHDNPCMQTDDVDYAAQMREQVTELTERVGFAGMLDREMAVLADSEPGVVVIDSQFSLRARSALNTSDRTIVHTSAMQPVEVGSGDPVQEKDTRLPITAGEEHQFARWHGHAVQAVGLDEIPAILTHLGENFRRTGVTRGSIATTVWHLAEKSRLVSGRAPTVIPALLPEDTPLRRLHDAGVAAVVPDSEGNGFSVLVDATRAGIAVEGSQMVALTGEITDPESGKEIELLVDDSSGTDIHQAIRGAVLLARRPIISATLTGAEFGQVRQALKGWREHDGRPALTYDADNTTVDQGQVLFVAGKKPIVLTVQQPNEDRQ